MKYKVVLCYSKNSLFEKTCNVVYSFRFVNIILRLNAINQQEKKKTYILLDY